MNLNYVEIVLIVAVCLLAIGNIISIITVTRKKKFRCPNNYNCADCIHSDAHWEGIKFRGYTCRLDR